MPELEGPGDDPRARWNPRPRQNGSRLPVEDEADYDELSVKLPNAEYANVELRKLREYCLNPQHPRGRNKARVSAAAGIRAADAEGLREAILAAARESEAQQGVAGTHGQRYIVDFNLVRPQSTVRIRSTRIVRAGENLPRLTSCYVL